MTDPAINGFAIHLRNEIRFSLLNHWLLTGDEPPDVADQKIDAVLSDVLRGLDFCLGMEQRLGTKRRFSSHDEIRYFLREKFPHSYECNNDDLIEWLVMHARRGGYRWWDD